MTYPMQPPVGGDRHQVWTDCDGTVHEEPAPGVDAVHSPEHGAVGVTYGGKAPEDAVEALEEKVARTPYAHDDEPGPGPGGRDHAVGAGRAGHRGRADDPRVNRFLAAYAQGPWTPEPGAACTGGTNGTAGR
ncbi:DUF3105 domain-containing protein [Streptomyces sp. TRM76323]|uniref:DUF3105 domain-containing protein n=1 Tax=Streptomyces tamarix TaxID=3078565 RepID=A0ABU3QLF4_9ACTN|nr:DUF3105 domain-containing protein [Streptomyces tamarix]MDT9683603.1 DUF3105 domain-containing protein [Streptomyces tamarix]